MDNCHFCYRGRPAPDEDLKPEARADTAECLVCGIYICADCNKHPSLPEGHPPEWHDTGVPPALEPLPFNRSPRLQQEEPPAVVPAPAGQPAVAPPPRRPFRPARRGDG